MITILIIVFICLISIISLATFLLVHQTYSMLMHSKEHTNIKEREIRFFKLYNNTSFDKYYTFEENLNLTNKLDNGDTDEFDVKLHCISNVPLDKLTNANFVIFHHGIKSTHEIGLKYSLIYLENKEPFVFISYDSRGWGESKNKYCSYGYYEKIDLHNIIQKIREKYSPNKLYLHGESMGGATLLQYLYKYRDTDNLTGLIVDSPYTNFANILKYIAKRNFPYIPFYYTYFFLELLFYFKHKFWIRDISLDRSLSTITTPVFVIFSECDALIPFTEYELLKQSSLNFRSFITKDSPHVLSIVFHKKEYINHINNFLAHSETMKKYNVKNLTWGSKKNKLIKV